MNLTYRRIALKVQDQTGAQTIMVWDCLERAKDAGDSKVIDACLRLINADRIG
jgi:hypothetical protein